MKIAVTYEDGRIFQHFGHTEQFKIYETADGRIVRAEVVDTNGSGHGALADFLMRQGVDALICGGIGGGAQAVQPPRTRKLSQPSARYCAARFSTVATLGSGSTPEKTDGRMPRPSSAVSGSYINGSVVSLF